MQANQQYGKPIGPRMGRSQSKARNRGAYEAGDYAGVEPQLPGAMAKMRGKVGVGGMVGAGAGALGAVGLLAQLLSSGGGEPETGAIGLSDVGGGTQDLDDIQTMVEMMKAKEGSPRFAAGDPEMRAFVEGEWDRVAQASMPVGRSLRERMAERGWT